LFAANFIINAGLECIIQHYFAPKTGCHALLVTGY
jgi:hypothetical protein